jgi:hypothetical protein
MDLPPSATHRNLHCLANLGQLISAEFALDNFRLFCNTPTPILVNAGQGCPIHSRL